MKHIYSNFIITWIILFLLSTSVLAAKTSFIDGNKTLGIQGTKVTATYLNGLQTHRHDGLDQDGSAPINYAQDTGSANVIVLTLAPALTAHITGMPIIFKAAYANTGGCTVNINGLGAKAIKNTSGADPAAGDIAAGSIVEIVYNGTSYTMVSANNATNHVSDISGNVHGATQNNTANMIVKRDASGNFSAGTITATLSGSATSAANATYATYLNSQPGSYYQPASTAINTSNIASQSVSTATNVTGTVRIPWLAKQAFRGAMVANAAGFNTALNPATIGYTSTVYDTDSTTTLRITGKITVPSGITKVRLSANLRAYGTGGLYIAFYENSGAVPNSPVLSKPLTNQYYDYFALTSGVLQVGSSTYYTVSVGCNVGTGLSDITFSVEFIE